MKKFLVVGITFALASGFALAASAQTHSAKDEINTAHAHAMMAASANTIAMAHTHLHHVINCLVGPGGKGFDAAAGTPCKGQGNGAIPDSASDHALGGKLHQALAYARTGLKSDDLASVHQDASKAAGGLQAADPAAPKSSSSW